MSDLTQRLFTSKTVLSVAIRQSTGRVHRHRHFSNYYSDLFGE